MSDQELRYLYEGTELEEYYWQDELEETEE